jgi:hypothetical protein
METQQTFIYIGDFTFYDIKDETYKKLTSMLFLLLTHKGAPLFMARFHTEFKSFITWIRIAKNGICYSNLKLQPKEPFGL